MKDRKKLDAAAAAAAAKLDLTQTQVDLLQSCARGIYEDSWYDQVLEESK